MGSRSESKHGEGDCTPLPPLWYWTRLLLLALGDSHSSQKCQSSTPRLVPFLSCFHTDIHISSCHLQSHTIRPSSSVLSTMPSSSSPEFQTKVFVSSIWRFQGTFCSKAVLYHWDVVPVDILQTGHNPNQGTGFRNSTVILCWKPGSNIVCCTIFQLWPGLSIPSCCSQGKKGSQIQ